MRKTNNQRSRFTYAFLIFILLMSSITMISITVIAQDESGQLYIALYDLEQQNYLDEESGIIFLEGREYLVEIFYEGENGQPIQTYNVTIDVPWKSFFIGYKEIISIETPSFEEYSEFIIIASKQEYNSAEKYAIVSKGDLFISADADTIEEGGLISVNVIDQNNEPVSGVTVYIDNFEDIFDTTNENGDAFINSPNVETDTEISITAIKSGYFPGSDTIHVENVKQPIINDFISKIFEVSPIVFALIFLLFAMLFVRFRKKTPLPISTSNTDDLKINKEIFIDKKEKWIKKNQSYKQTKQINKKIGEIPTSAKGSHVEIIRIRGREDKNKETKNISENKKGLNKIIPLNKKNEYEWFNGTDTMKYKIDKLTGDVNEKPAEKWFIGEDNIRFKVDKKVIDKKLKKKCSKNAS